MRLSFISNALQHVDQYILFFYFFKVGSHTHFLLESITGVRDGVEPPPRQGATMRPSTSPMPVRRDCYTADGQVCYIYNANRS
jgi:hypothetical protein